MTDKNTNWTEKSDGWHKTGSDTKGGQHKLNQPIERRAKDGRPLLPLATAGSEGIDIAKWIKEVNERDRA